MACQGAGLISSMWWLLINMSRCWTYLQHVVAIDSHVKVLDLSPTCGGYSFTCRGAGLISSMWWLFINMSRCWTCASPTCGDAQVHLHEVHLQHVVTIDSQVAPCSSVALLAIPVIKLRKA